MSRYKSKYYLKKEIDIIMKKLYEINSTFELFKNLVSGENYEYICKSIPYSMKLILDALFEKVLLELFKLLCDVDKKSITILDIINLDETNKHYFKEKKSYYAIDAERKIRRNLNIKNVQININQLKNDIKRNKYIIEYLGKRRNKSMAHNDKKFQYDRKNKYSNKKFI